MTLEQFNSLDLEKRTEAIWEWGFFVSRNKTENINKVLYAIHGYFAEMSLSLENNAVINIRGIAKPDEIEQNSYFIANNDPFIQIATKKAL
ncbi:MAG: hypothetical protein JNL60_01185 [Bacteroidia bacterium]|nr:hypothetical protein [Bacteroidia bacterium]